MNAFPAYVLRQRSFAAPLLHWFLLFPPQKMWLWHCSCLKYPGCHSYKYWGHRRTSDTPCEFLPARSFPPPPALKLLRRDCPPVSEVSVPVYSSAPATAAAASVTPDSGYPVHPVSAPVSSKFRQSYAACRSDTHSTGAESRFPPPRYLWSSSSTAALFFAGLPAMSVAVLLPWIC